jgi:hypothetical protein
MKKKIALFLMFLLVFSLLSTYAKKQTIEEKYKDRLEKTYVGMSVEEFKKLWPKWKGPVSTLDPEFIGFKGYYITEKGLLGGIEILYFWFKDDKFTHYTVQRA